MGGVSSGLLRSRRPAPGLTWWAWACVRRSLWRTASGVCTARRRLSGWGVQWRSTSSAMVSECEALGRVSVGRGKEEADPSESALPLEQLSVGT